MDRHVVIPLFTSVWWQGFIISAIVIAALIMWARRMPPHIEKRFRLAIVLSVFIREIIWHIFLIDQGTWEVAESLPLHLCGISRILGAVLLLFPRQLIFEYLILLGMTGAVQSFITPELTHGNHPVLVVDFYYAHAVIIFMALYAFFVMKLKLNKWSWLRTFIFGHLLLTVVGIINYFIGGNYIFLCERPLADNPLIIGEWPFYLISFQVFALIHILFFWFLFRRLQVSAQNA